MPSSLSEDSQDLIRRMLVVEPEKRITMEEIKNHKWFKSGHAQLPEPIPVQVHQNLSFLNFLIRQPSSSQKRSPILLTPTTSTLKSQQIFLHLGGILSKSWSTPF